jgi:hypothetical protein
MMTKKILWLGLGTALLSVLSACGGDDSTSYEQQLASADEPSNQTLDSANEIIAPSAFSTVGVSSGVFGALEAGDSDYYYVDVDFFERGDHEITLTNLDDDLDLEVTDWNGIEYNSQASGTADEFISLSTEEVSFFGEDDPDDVRISIRVYGKTNTSAGDFTLTFTSYDND